MPDALTKTVATTSSPATAIIQPQLAAGIPAPPVAAATPPKPPAVVPTIAVQNLAKTALGVDFGKLVSTLQNAVDGFFSPVWGLSGKLVARAPQPGEWSIVFLDTADEANALGYHDLTANDLPLAKVFVKTTLQAGERVDVTASHELFEMLLDPFCNLYSMTPGGTLVAYEASDACEEASWQLNGLMMSDFLWPAWFEPHDTAGAQQYDQMNICTAPFQLLKGGYSIVVRKGKVGQIFGSKEKALRFAKEDRRMHRSEYRRVG